MAEKKAAQTEDAKPTQAQDEPIVIVDDRPQAEEVKAPTEAPEEQPEELTEAQKHQKRYSELKSEMAAIAQKYVKLEKEIADAKREMISLGVKVANY